MVLHAITGKPASDYSVNPTNIARAWNSGELIVLSSDSKPRNSDIVGGHAYAVVGYNPWLGEPFEVFNPWGVDSLVPLGNSYWMAPGNTVFGLFFATAACLSQNFTDQTVGSGAIDVNNGAGTVGNFTNPADLGGGSRGVGRLARCGESSSAARPAQQRSEAIPILGTALGYPRPHLMNAGVTDAWDASLTGYVNDATAIHSTARRHERW